jgi:hypothetical protein
LSSFVALEELAIVDLVDGAKPGPDSYPAKAWHGLPEPKHPQKHGGMVGLRKIR